MISFKKAQFFVLSLVAFSFTAVIFQNCAKTRFTADEGRFSSLSCEQNSEASTCHTDAGTGIFDTKTNKCIESECHEGFTFNESKQICESSSCAADQKLSCDIYNLHNEIIGSGERACDSRGEFGLCEAQACSLGFELVNGTCSPAKCEPGQAEILPCQTDMGKGQRLCYQGRYTEECYINQCADPKLPDTNGNKSPELPSADSNTNNSNSNKTPEPKKVVECGPGYEKSGEVCVKITCRSGEYFSDSQNKCIACSNKPTNSTFSGIGQPNSNSCPWTCDSGYAKVGNSCVSTACGSGNYFNGTQCVSCTNKPANSIFSGSGGLSNSCPWTCNSGHVKVSNSCVSTTCSSGNYFNGTQCVSCTNKPANSIFSGSGGSSNSCPWTCNSGHVKVGNSCVSTHCTSGNYFNGTKCVSCTNKPANSIFSGSGGLSNSCPWTCNSGYVKSGNSCILPSVSLSCTPTEATENSTVTCNSTLSAGINGSSIKWFINDNEFTQPAGQTGFNYPNPPAGTYRVKAQAVVAGTNSIVSSQVITVAVGSAATSCPSNGTYDGSTKKCTVTETATENLESNWVVKNVCNDHHGLITINNIAGNTAQVKFHNFSPSYVPGWNCPYATKSMGSITLTSSSGRDMSNLVSLDKVTIQYASVGGGCNSRNGNVSINNPSTYSSQKGNPMYYVSYCPADGAQTATVRVKVAGSATFQIKSQVNPICPSGKTMRANGYCY